MADQFGRTGPRLFVGDGEGGPVLAGAEQALLILGPPRSGKTSTVVVPNILAAGGPVVATSTKTDVLAATRAARSAHGRCLLFDPTGSAGAATAGRTRARGPATPEVEPLRWSPVAAAAEWDDAMLTARALVGAARPAPAPGDVHWNERAQALLGPLLHAAAVAGLAMRDVVAWVNRHDARPALSELGAAGADHAVDVLTGIDRTDGRELSGIWSTAAGVLSAYQSASALGSADHPDFDPDAFVRSGDTVYVCAGGSHQEAAAPLVAGLLDAVVTARYRAHASEGARAPLLLALDETANIAPLPKLPAVVSEGGGQGVLTIAAFQDLSQARWRWGDRADGFLTLFGAKLLLPGVADVRTLEAVSALAGETDVAVVSRSSGPAWGRRRGTTVTHSSRRQRRLPVDELRRGRAGSAVLVEGDADARWVRLTPWDRSEVWRRLAAGPAHDRGADRGSAAQRRPIDRDLPPALH